MKSPLCFALLCFSAAILSIVAGCSTAQQPGGIPPSPKSPTPVWVLQSSNLVNATITVSAGSHYNISFSITSAMTNPRVKGSFTASGGSGNDIETFIFDDMAYTNWVNGHQVNTFYNSGRITVANIDASITTPGKYHLVFNNGFSIFTSKHVSTTVNLEWYELRYQ